MWYVIQTVTGQEEELISLIRTILKKELLKDCFVIRAEWMKRLGGRWQTQVRTLFPGYIFIDTARPDEVFFELRNVPKYSKVLGAGTFEFTPVNEDEQRFLSKLLEHDKWNGSSVRIVKLSDFVTDDAGSVVSVDGTLQYFRENIVRINLHKRYAVIEITLFHKKRTLIFGIKLKQDSQEADLKSINHTKLGG